jgi:hypothetical protein
VVQANNQIEINPRRFVVFLLQRIANVFLVTNVLTFSPQRQPTTSGVLAPLPVRSSRRERRNQYSIPTSLRPAHW